MLGRPLRLWLQLFLLSHRPAADGWQRLAWPDGGPLLAQSWPLVLALHAIGDELDAVAADRRREVVSQFEVLR
ncbi:MAG TPA: hypothetical protein VKB51_01740 [bacterium]|nr:hypothetical protein [bacterium]